MKTLKNMVIEIKKDKDMLCYSVKKKPLTFLGSSWLFVIVKF